MISAANALLRNTINPQKFCFSRLQPSAEVGRTYRNSNAESTKFHRVLEVSEVFLPPGQVFLGVLPRAWTGSQQGNTGLTRRGQCAPNGRPDPPVLLPTRRSSSPGARRSPLPHTSPDLRIYSCFQKKKKKTSYL